MATNGIAVGQGFGELLQQRHSDAVRRTGFWSSNLLSLKRITRGIARLALPVMVPITTVALISEVNAEIRHVMYMGNELFTSSGTTLETIDNVAQARVAESVYKTTRPSETPPRPIDKVFGAIAIQKVIDNRDGTEYFQFIRNPAIVGDLPNGEIRAAGGPGTHAPMEVMPGPFVLCASEGVTPTVEYSPIGLSVSGGPRDSRVGPIQRFPSLPEECQVVIQPSTLPLHASLVPGPVAHA